jgi:5'-methylthioadenosine phosphorylase
MTQSVLGIIGGSGIYDLPGLENMREETVASPWGEPSDTFRIGEIAGRKLVFLPRHGRGHRLGPSQINYRANIDAMKRLGVTDLVSLSACGSYRSELYPGLFVLVDQFVDRTFRRETSFFGAGCVAHVALGHPVGPLLQERIADAMTLENIAFQRGGTLVTMEGPQFSTRAESLANKAQEFDLIGMTAMPEAKLAREAEITYATVAMVTDFDCWHPEHDDVDVKSVLEIMHGNVEKARR